MSGESMELSVPPRAIATERLVLEPTLAAHGDATWVAIEASLPELKRWMAWSWDTSHERAIEFATKAERQWKEGEAFDFAITHGGELVGTIGLNRIMPLWKSANLGYWLRSDLSGRGLVTEAASAVVAFGFETVGLHRIEIVAGVENIPSWRIAEKLGFQREGILRHGCWVGPTPLDTYLYARLATDPPTTPRPVGAS